MIMRRNDNAVPLSPECMGLVHFIQYLRPNGHRADVAIERPRAIADKAAWILSAGYALECEAVPVDMVCFTISDPGAEEDVAVLLCPNGPEVPETVDRLIGDFYAKMQGRQLQ